MSPWTGQRGSRVWCCANRSQAKRRRISQKTPPPGAAKRGPRLQAAVDEATILALGCSKCRWSKKGCAQCKKAYAAKLAKAAAKAAAEAEKADKEAVVAVVEEPDEGYSRNLCSGLSGCVWADRNITRSTISFSPDGLPLKMTPLRTMVLLSRRGGQWAEDSWDCFCRG